MSKHPSQDDLAAYAIGGLDGREERVVAKHLERCEECATELAETRPGGRGPRRVGGADRAAAGASPEPDGHGAPRGR